MVGTWVKENQDGESFKNLVQSRYVRTSKNEKAF
jgi:hypothetical protein